MVQCYIMHQHHRRHFNVAWTAKLLLGAQQNVNSECQIITSLQNRTAGIEKSQDAAGKP